MTSTPAGSSEIKRPPYNPAVAAALDTVTGSGMFAPLTAETIPLMRQYAISEDLRSFDLEQLEFTVPGSDGADLALTVLRPRGHVGTGPGIFHIHGGGMVMGSRMTGVSIVAPWVAEHRAVVATVEYRLAPEHPHPVPLEDCYAALVWVVEHAPELGMDADRILLAGASAGGGLAAGVALLSRDRGYPAPLGQMLLAPMLDDRDNTVSAQQFDGVGVWDRNSNVVGWNALLGERRGSEGVSVYAAPARATDLSGLAPTYLDVGGAEVFRDETVAYASMLWRDGNDAELHVWPGGTHGWEAFMVGSSLAQSASETRHAWVSRLFAASREGDVH